MYLKIVLVLEKELFWTGFLDMVFQQYVFLLDIGVTQSLHDTCHS
jgi:hypothetical protein